MSTAADPSAPPSRELLLLEVRAIWELGAFFTAYPLLRLAPRGDGHPVLVLPGLAASDVSTRPLRKFLKDQGWAAHGWKLGPNRGPQPGAEARMQARIDELAARYQRKVSLVGWSLGGILARELARRSSANVRQVITLGSPFAGAPKASHAWQLYERQSGLKVEDWPQRADMGLPPPVPSTTPSRPSGYPVPSQFSWWCRIGATTSRRCETVETNSALLIGCVCMTDHSAGLSFSGFRRMGA